MAKEGRITADTLQQLHAGLKAKKEQDASQRAALETQVRELAEQVSRLTKSLGAADIELAGLRAENEQLRTTTSASKETKGKETAKDGDQVQSLRESLEAAERRATAAESQLSQAQEQSGQDQDELGRLRRQVEENQRQLAGLREQLEQPKSSEPAKKAKGKAKPTDESNLAEALGRATRAEQALESLQEQADAAQRQLQEQIDQLRREVQRATEAANRADERVAEAQRQLADARKSQRGAPADGLSKEDGSFLGVTRTLHRAVDISPGVRGTVWAFEQSSVAAAVTTDTVRQLHTAGFQRVEIHNLHSVDQGYVPVVCVYAGEHQVIGMLAYQEGDPVAVVSIKGSWVRALASLLAAHKRHLAEKRPK
jgi:predicted  nucleic acid-binding Zn-ribbon protein